MTEGKLDASGKRFFIVASRWNEFVVKELVAGAERAFRMHGGSAEVVWVPGTWEIPIAAMSLIASPATKPSTAGKEVALEPTQIRWEEGIRPPREGVRGGEHGRPDAIVCVGCILQGATFHAQQLANVVASALTDISARTGVPITWGVLTCTSQEEAIERAGMKLGNKGEEAARAAIEMACLRAELSRQS